MAVHPRGVYYNADAIEDSLDRLKCVQREVAAGLRNVRALQRMAERYRLPQLASAEVVESITSETLLAIRNY